MSSPTSDSYITLKPLIKVLSKYPFTKRLDDAGYDIYADEEIMIPSGTVRLIKTDLKLSFPPCLLGRIHSRSGLSLKGKNTLAGVVDSSYRGLCNVVMHNISDTDYHVLPGDRVAQIVFHYIEHNPEIIRVENEGELP